MSLSPTRRQAERLADLLESHARTDDPTLAPLVALAGALRTATVDLTPRPEFRDALRQRLVAVATVQGVGHAAPATTRLRETATSWRFQRRVAAVAAGAAAVTAVVGVGIGASRSLPGDAFYGLKRASESIQLAAAHGDEAKGKRHLQFARTRLAEIESLAGHDSALPVATGGRATAAGAPQADASTFLDTLQDMDDETRAGANDLLAAYRASGSTEPLRALDEFTQAQYTDLVSVLPELPAAAQPRAKSSLSLLSIVRVRTSSLERARTQQPTTHPTTTPTNQRPRPHPTSTPTAPTATTSAPAPSASGGSSGSTTRQSAPGTEVPTIPPLPTILPVPTEIPTLEPTLLPGVSLSPLPLLGG